VELKDYYTILELQPSATPEEIKKAYRRLAQVYHPDKKPGDPYAHSRFTIIKEAYETLSNPASREQYLQQRWYARSMGKRTSAVATTPVEILKQLLDLDRYVHSSDVHRMEQEGLYRYICEVLSDSNISLLHSFREPEVNREIVNATLRSAGSMPHPLAAALATRLQTVDDSEESNRNLQAWVRQRRQAAYWDKARVWVILLLVLALSAIIFLASRI
jgi:curved DNA-binding protein CbpA